MSDNDKDQRHAHDHDQAEDQDDAHSQGDDHHHRAAASRVADADRKDSKVAKNVEAFLFKAEAHGKKTRISFGPSVAAGGDEQAAFKPGMSGYVKLGNDHMVAKFTITDVKREGQGGNSITAHAIVDVPASEFANRTGMSVIVNPTSYPDVAPATGHDIKGRIQAKKREDDFHWLLLATAGIKSGVREGMNGVGLDADGKKVGAVVVKTVEDNNCWVEVNLDQNTTNHIVNVVLNPS